MNVKLFQANQISLENNILAQGASVGLMTSQGTHCLGHDQRATKRAGGSRNSRQQPCSEAIGPTLKKE